MTGVQTCALPIFLLLLADIGARLIVQPQELPVGIVMPLLGAPFFIYLTRSQVRR